MWPGPIDGFTVRYHFGLTLGDGENPAGHDEWCAQFGETPLYWGGKGAVQLGLVGRVHSSEYWDVFGPGGCFLDGERLVRTSSPGVELVLTVDKSVSVLAALGRPDHASRIVDAYIEAALGWLDGQVADRGGRAGRGGAVHGLPTSGLAYATTFHTTSRAGDPHYHAHVLVANVVSVNHALTRTWRALDTRFVYRHLAAAETVGQMAGAAMAVRLGYRVESFPDSTNRWLLWRIADVPAALTTLFSKRSAEMDEAMAARTRAGLPSHHYLAKRFTASGRPDRENPDSRTSRWRSEMSAAGFDPKPIWYRLRSTGARETRTVNPGLCNQPGVDIERWADPGSFGEVVATTWSNVSEGANLQQVRRFASWALTLDDVDLVWLAQQFAASPVVTFAAASAGVFAAWRDGPEMVRS